MSRARLTATLTMILALATSSLVHGQSPTPAPAQVPPAGFVVVAFAISDGVTLIPAALWDCVPRSPLP